MLEDLKTSNLLPHPNSFNKVCYSTALLESKEMLVAMFLKETALKSDLLTSSWRSVLMLMMLSDKKKATFFNKFPSTLLEREHAQLLEALLTKTKS